jgi:hypothetical protein
MSDELLVVELDACNHDDLPLAVGVALKLITLDGPSGWPVVQVSGKREAATAYITEHWGGHTMEDLIAAGV